MRRSWADYPVTDRVTVGLRVPRSVKARLGRMASKSGRSLAAEVERLLELGLAADTMIALGQSDQEAE